MATKRFTERFTLTHGTVDRTGPYPVIKDVLLCGKASANKRRYDKAFTGTHKRYENKLVFLNHSKSQSRTYEDKLGWVENERRNADGLPIGDIGVNPNHPYAETFLFDAEHRPNDCGMSHVAQCKTTLGHDGWDDVTDVVTVESVDVVIGPATTKGLYEHIEGNAVNKISLKKFIETCGPKWGAKKWAAATKLCEDMGDMADMPVVDEPAPDASVEDGDLKAALLAALAPMLDEAFESGNPDKAVTALKDFIRLHAKHTGGAATGGAAEPDGDEMPALEQKRRAASWDVLTECTALAYHPTPTELKALSLMPTAEERRAFVTEQKAKRPGETPSSPERRPGAGSAGNRKVIEQTTTNANPSPVPTDGLAFAKSLRG